MKKQSPSLRGFSVKRTFVFPDTHFQASLSDVAPAFSHDPDALSVALQICNDWKPDQIIHLGDICEMGTISQWTKTRNRESQVQGADKQWYQSTWAPQMKMVEGFWGYLAKKHPQATRHQLEGNHDWWSAEEFSKAPLSQFADRSFRNLSLWSDLNIDLHLYDYGTNEPWVDVGAVRVVHGYKNVSASRMRMEHDNVVYGHQHKILYNAWDANSRASRRAWCIGCLTRLNPDYNSRGGAQNGWAHGFGVIYTLPDGDFMVQSVEIHKGRVIDFHGKTYVAKPLHSIDPTLRCLEL